MISAAAAAEAALAVAAAWCAAAWLAEVVRAMPTMPLLTRLLDAARDATVDAGPGRVATFKTNMKISYRYYIIFS